MRKYFGSNCHIGTVKSKKKTCSGANSVFILLNFIHLRFFFHKKLIPIESNGEHPCGIVQWAKKREKNKNIVAFFAYNKIFSFFLMSKTAKKLTERIVFKILFVLK